MAKVIAVATKKGGDGKTTTAIQLADYFAYVKGKKGLIIDKDPQANISSHYISMVRDPYAVNLDNAKKPCAHPDYNETSDEAKDWDGVSSTADIYAGRNVWPYSTKIDTLSIIPAYSSPLQDVEAVKKYEMEEKIYNQFVNFIQLDAIQSSYDFIIIDTRPSKGPLTTAAIKAATHMIIPCKMEYFSMDGIYEMLGMWSDEVYTRDPDNQLELVGVLPNLMRNTKNHLTYLDDLKNEIPDYLIPYQLKERTIYSELMPFESDITAVHELPKNNIARQESETVCEYVFNKVFNDDKDN